VTEPSEVLTTVEAAERLDVGRRTIIDWLLGGYLQGTLQSKRTGWRIPVSDVDHVAREREGER
jgi:excisionase family DNA binding protein